MKHHPMLPLSRLSRRSVVRRAVVVGTALGLGSRLGRVLADDASPRAGPGEFLWESRGDPDSPLGHPSHLAVAPDGTFSLGGDGVLAEAYRRAGFRDVVVESIAAPVQMASLQEFVQFVRDSFGALHQMMAGLSDAERADTWTEIERELSQFAGPHGFTGPCEMIVGVGVK